jgi:hypothetical protein
MATFIRPTVISETSKEPTSKRKPSKVLLIIGIVFFILLFIPDPIKFIPFLNIGEEVAEGGISFTALAIYGIRYWLYKNIKEQVTGK